MEGGPTLAGLLRGCIESPDAVPRLLADWLESPQFPRGLHTLLAQPEKEIPITR